MIMHRQNCGNSPAAVLSGLGGAFLGVLLGALLVYVMVSPQLRTAEPAPVPTAVAQEPSNAQSASSVELNVREAPATTTPAGSPSDTANAVAAVAPAVVNIDTTQVRRVYEQTPFGISPFDSQIREIPKGMGTGVIIGADGIVLTNNHVVANTKTIRVTLSNKSQYTAKVLGTDALSDLAILKISDTKPFATAKLTDSRSTRIGDWVVALGNPLGVGQTATVGVLSARGRHLSDTSVELRDLLQTDAAINPGNSGGPLVNMHGEVIGINTAIIPYAQGIGFAIPAETAVQVISSLKAHGRVVRPYLGIEMGDLNPNICEHLGIPETTRGVVIGRIVSGGPAQKAGMQSGDVILKVNGIETTNSRDLQATIRSLKIDSTATVSILRSDKQMEIKCVLKEMPTRILR